MPNSSQIDKRWLNPTNFRTNVAFLLIATMLLAIFAWMMKVSLISSFAETSLSLRYSPWNTLIPIKVWMRMAVVLTLNVAYLRHFDWMEIYC